MHLGIIFTALYSILLLKSSVSLGDDTSKLSSSQLNSRDAMGNLNLQSPVNKNTADSRTPDSSDESTEQRGANIKNRPSKCVPIEIPMCKDIGYNLTYLPNEFNHMTQEEAGLEVHQFWPLVNIQCSKDLRLFLCSMYVPMCVPDEEWPRRVPPCKSLCQSARDGCEPIMRRFGFNWPAQMNCDQFDSGKSQTAQETICEHPTEPKTTPRPKETVKNNETLLSEQQSFEKEVSAFHKKLLLMDSKKLKLLERIATGIEKIVSDIEVEPRSQEKVISNMLRCMNISVEED